MGFVFLGVTHCAKCLAPLNDKEVYLCKSCEKERKMEKSEDDNKHSRVKLDKYGRVVP